ncbi:pentapeptide repeat-containing protein [Mycobacterium intermedium]|uniref:pentapeptide repeat-containing protein n=1 Tax=Mycobacterium intermedium TaxID=28445 RepID=UPI0009F294FC|nr:pentapeptide repeat-containing protein [Mycobacterium intermedium]
MFNSGGFNTGWGNAGSYNTGGFNAGSFNTGSFNPGDTNTGDFNTGDTNTGVGNTGNINTGAFISGNESNGMFWRGDRQGLMAADYTLTIPEIPLTLGGGGGILRLPVTGQISALSVNPFSVHAVGGGAIPVNLDITVDADTQGFDIEVDVPSPFPNFSIPVSGLPIQLTIPLRSELAAFQIPRITVAAIPLNLTVGGSTTFLDVNLGGSVGPITVPVIHLSPMPGFGNSTSAPSSGFFNSGEGGASGFGNIGEIISGYWNVGSFVSGFENYGGRLLSGLTNLGSAISGVSNTSALDLAIASVISGVGNLGHQLSGLFLSGSVP